ncbi:beta-galactosidase [candidate division KSB1 bacterium]|nr:beta-galactosidase [candidate division KSB1 bacterium]
MEKKLHHSAAYYPELWELDQVDEDIALMKQAGLNAVRIAEFAWSRMEPELGKYEFDWLQLVLDRLHDSGIGAILCTPTPTPPAWLSETYPEILLINKLDRRMTHGSRRHYCYNSPTYRRLCAQIIEQLARRFGRHPAVIGWQTDNEFFCHVEACYCETCKAMFQRWLKEKFGTIENLNHTWGTHIWSEYYNRFEQVPLPVPTATLHNCSLVTAFWQFASQSMVNFQKEQLDVIRAHSDQPVTHNAMPPFHHLDYDDLFADLDFGAIDAYIPVEKWWRAIYEFDWMRRKCSRPFWVMETDTSWTGSVASDNDPTPRGFTRMKGLTAYGMGGQGVSYWLWRQQRTGCEMNWSSVITAWGKPTPGWDDVRTLSSAMPKVEAFLFDAPVPRAEVAIHYSNRSRIMLDVEPMTTDFKFYDTWFDDGYKPLFATGVFRDVLFESALVDGYKIVYTPFLPAIDPALLEKMKRYVEQGGTWIIGPMTGYRTPDHTVHTEAALGALEAFAGVPVVFSFPVNQQPVKVKLAHGATAGAKHWAFSFGDLKDARSLGEYTSHPAAGQCWGYEKTIGKGKLIHTGAGLDESSQTHFLRIILQSAALATLYDSTWGTTVVPRKGNSRQGFVISNWDAKGGRVKLPHPGVDLLTGRSLSGEIRLEPCEVLIVEIK